MNTETYRITVHGLNVMIVRKSIRNLHLGVYPPDGRVRIAAPMAMSDNAVRLAIVGKLGWIKRQQAKFAAQPRLSEREMVSGESHYFFGKRYRLRIVERPEAATVLLRSNTIDLHVRPNISANQREEALQKWYREQLRVVIPPLLEKWQNALGVKVYDWGIKRMKTKWGSCNIKARRIWLNLELAKKPVQCLEYIIVHEIVHLLEKNHNEIFVSHMDKFFPKWRFYKERLNRSPLRHETWSY